MVAEIEIAVVCAGVMGPAIARKIARREKGVFVFEKKRTLGLETSGRNSKVIHADIYYPHGSLKALCVEGKHFIYDLCDKHNNAYERCGK